MLIEVTAEDIRLGKPGSLCNCPVALAVKRAYKATRVMADALSISVGRFKVATPPEVEVFLHKFDLWHGHKRCPKPFSFRIDDLTWSGWPPPEYPEDAYEGVA